MANFVLDFLQGIAQPFEQFGKAAANFPSMLAADVTNNPVAQQHAQQRAFGTNNQGQIARDIIGSTANIGLDIAAPGIAKGVEAPIAGAVGGLGGKVLGGAAAGAAIGGPGGLAQGVESTQPLNAKNLSLDFLQGAGTGAAIGGAIPGMMGAARAYSSSDFAANQIGGIGPGVGDILDDETAGKIAKSEDPGKIEKLLTPTTGPAVAKDLSEPLANMTKDPDIVKNVVKNDLQSKLSPTQQSNTPVAPEVGQPSPAPAETTPSSGVGVNNVAQQGAGKGVSPEEQSLFDKAPSEAQPFLNAPGMEGRSMVGDLGAVTTANHMLNNGAPVSEVVSQYMEQTNSSYADAQANISKLMKESDQSSLQKGNINKSLNPRYEEGTNLVADKVEAGDNKSVINKTAMSYGTVQRAGNTAVEEVQKLSSADQNLLSQMRDKTPEQVAQAATQAKNPEQFLRAWQATKDYSDLNQGIGAGGLKQNLAYRQNQLLTRYMRPREETAGTQLNPALAPIRPGYAMGRSMTENGASADMVPAFDNFLDELKYDVEKKSGDIGQLTFMKSVEEAYPGQVSIGVRPAGYTQLQLPFAKKVFLPDSLAAEFNRRAPAEAGGSVAKWYDLVNSELKSVKLGGGLFHSFNVLGSWVGQQITSGKLFTHPEDTANMIKTTFSPQAMRGQLSQLDQAGMLKAADRLGLTYNRFGVAADVGNSGKLGNIPVLKQIHELTFGRQIPMMKLLTLQQKLESNGIDPLNMSSKDIQTGTKLAMQTNKGYGGLNRMIQGLTPKQFKVVSRGVLAGDYTESQLQTLFDAFTKGGADGRLAREIVAGKALLFGGLATGAGVAGGEFVGKSPSQVAEDVAYKLINPSFQFGGYKVGLPETQASEFMKPLAQSALNETQGKNAANPLKDFFTARAAALPSEAYQQASNRDFYGNPIRGTDYYGRPIPAASSIENTLAGVTPIPVAQGINTASGKQNIGAAIANTLGAHATPLYDASYAPIQGQTYVQRLKAQGAPSTQVNADSQFFAMLGQGTAGHSKVQTKIESEIAQGKTAQAQADMAAYNQKIVQALKPWVNSDQAQYFDSSMFQILRSSMFNLASLSKYTRSDVKKNPTKYGLSVTATAPLPPEAVNKRRS